MVIVHKGQVGPRVPDHMLLDLIPVGLEAGKVGVIEDNAGILAEFRLIQKDGGDRCALEVEIAIEPGALETGDVLELGKAEEGKTLKLSSRKVGSLGKAGQIEIRLLRKDRFAKGGEAGEVGQAELDWAGKDGIGKSGAVEAGLEEVGSLGEGGGGKVRRSQ